jgi:hypothetical protein
MKFPSYVSAKSVVRTGMVREATVRWFLGVIIAVLAVVAVPGFTGRAYAGDPASKYDLSRRVTDAARILANNPRFKNMPASQREKLVEFVVGNLIFALGHESGHAVMREMKIPVVSHEEDAADVFATLMALMCTDAFADRVLANAALGWFLSDRRSRRNGVEMVYYDEHGIDLQRAFNIVCLMVGANMEKFRDMAAVAKLPNTRQLSCAEDYLSASWSWEQVLKPHQRKPDDPKTALNVVYGPGEGKYDLYAEVARRVKLLEAIADNLSDAYVWPAPISLEMQVCGNSGAFFQLRTKRVVVCYELAEEFADLYRAHGRSMVFTVDDKTSAAPPSREASALKQKGLRAKRRLR